MAFHNFEVELAVYDTLGLLSVRLKNWVYTFYHTVLYCPAYRY